MELIEAPAFTRYLHDCLDNEQYQALQTVLVNHPEADGSPPLWEFLSAAVRPIPLALRFRPVGGLRLAGSFGCAPGDIVHRW